MDVIDILQSTPEKIKKLELEIFELKYQEEEDTLIIKNTEESIMNKIREEVTEDSKPVYTNESKRKEELRNRLLQDKVYQATLLGKKENQIKAKKLEINRDYLARLFRAAEAISRVK